jgi:hypothetical protein
MRRDNLEEQREEVVAAVRREGGVAAGEGKGPQPPTGRRASWTPTRRMGH